MDHADLSVVQLSDLHLRAAAELEAIGPPESLASYIRGYARARTLVLAFVGDLAWSGKSDQYALTGEYLRRLVREVEDDFETVEVFLLPGNHDVDFDLTHLRERVLDGLLQAPPPSQRELVELCAPQEPFFSFAGSLESRALDWTGRNMATTFLELKAGMVQVTALNTASCSRIGEDPNSLFVDIEALPERDERTVCHIVMMHHPLHWLHESVRKACAEWIGRSAELALTGHEHDFDQVELTRRNLPATQYVAGQALFDPSVEREGFQVLNINLATRECEVQVLVRRGKEYERTETVARRLATASERAKALRPSDAFLTQIEQLNVGIRHKSGRPITHASIFVHPDLRVQPGKNAPSKVENTQYLDGALLSDRILLEGRMLVVGEEYSGKTFLLRQLFKEFLSKGVYPVLVSAKRLRTGTIEQAVQEGVRAQYDSDDLTAYFSVPVKDRVLLIEDLDLLPDAHKGIDDLAAYARQNFGAFALTCRELMLLRDPLTGQGSQELWSLPTAFVSSMSHIKRAELIARWVAHEDLSSHDAHVKEVGLEKRLNELLAQRAVPPLPMALTLILESMDSRDSVDESTGAFGYHYQRIILQSLSGEQSRRARERLTTVTDDIALELLGRIAYKAFAAKATESDEETLRQTAIETRNDLIIDFSIDAAVDTLLGSGLVKPLGQGALGFQFKYVFQYSVAKLLALWLNNDDRAEDVRRVIGELTVDMHDPANASILIFFTFLTRDSATIRGVVEQARRTFSDAEPCDFGEGIDRFFPEPRVPMIGPSANVQRNREELNRKRDRADELGRRSIESLDEIRTESREAVMEIDKAFQCMQVLGQVLRAYPTRLSGEEKKLVAGECYSLGLRTLSKFVDAIGNAEQLVKEYFRRITADQVDAHDMVEFERELERHVAQFVRIGSLAIVKRVARAVGSVHLRPLYPQIQVPNGDRPVKLINRAIGLELLNELRANDTVGLYQELKEDKCRVASAVLQMLVWEYLFLHPVQGSQRQSILKRMDMVDHPGLLGNRYRGRKGLVGHGKTGG